MLLWEALVGPVGVLTFMSSRDCGVDFGAGDPVCEVGVDVANGVGVLPPAACSKWNQ